MLLFYIWLMYIDKIKECIFIYDIHSLDFYFILIIFLDNSFILSDRICSFPSILTSKYMLRVIGKPTEAIRFCKSNSIKYTPFNNFDKIKAMQLNA